MAVTDAAPDDLDIDHAGAGAGEVEHRFAPIWIGQPSCAFNQLAVTKPSPD
jgi:hypothetical protein